MIVVVDFLITLYIYNFIFGAFDLNSQAQLGVEYLL